jgi:hypothetical protein
MLDPEHPERQEYFFGGDEYEGLTIPYKSPGTHIPGGYYAFTLAFYFPGSRNQAWALSKCTWHEPDPILQDLITILENNFINRFEEP